MKRKSSKYTGSKIPKAAESGGTSEISEGFNLTEKKAAKTPWYKKPVFVKSGYLLIALIVATTLWGYVLMSENPPRTKRLDNIPISFESGSESDLAAKNLVILGDIHEILKTVSVDIKTTLNDLPRFTENAAENIVRASVSVQNVLYEAKAGEYELKITAVSNIGEVISVTPSSVTVIVDDLISRPVPITYNFSGRLPDNYWRGEPQLAASNTTVRGAKSVVDKVVRAACFIDLDGRTEPVNDSFPLKMYDAERNPVESVNAGTVFPSVIVRMDIRPTVDIRVAPDISGRDSMSDIYEIAGISIVPDTVKLAVKEENIDNIRDLLVYDTAIDLAGVREEGILEYTVSISDLPENAFIIGQNKFYVKIEIRERIEEKIFERVPVKFINEDTDKYAYNYTENFCTVIVKGKASAVRRLNSWDIVLTVNLDGKTEGVYTLIPEIEFAEPELIEEITYIVGEIDFEIAPAKV